MSLGQNENTETVGATALVQVAMVRPAETHLDDLKHRRSWLQKRGIGEIGRVHRDVHSGLAHLQQLLVKRRGFVVLDDLCGRMDGRIS